jgi:uncharacterized repeat protein (TIGR02543 family)
MWRKLLVLTMLWTAFLRPAAAQTQLIVNGNFTSASYAPWMLQGAGIQVYPSPGYLSMGNINGGFQEVYQTVTFPADMIAASLSFYYNTESTDPNGDDTLAIYIADTSLNVLQELGGTTSATTTSSSIYTSTNFIQYAGDGILSSYAGQTVDLVFVVYTDSTYGYLTSFDITDVNLVATTSAVIPPNDNFANAIVIPSNSYTTEANTTYASKQPGEPDPAGNVGGHSLWWTWTAPAIGTVTIDTAASDFITLLAIYTGSAINGLTSVVSDNGVYISTGHASVQFNVSAGTEYRIDLDGYNGEAGTTELSLNFSRDITPPTVTIQSPAAGVDVTGPIIEVKGVASDNIAVASVDYQLQNNSGATPWQPVTGLDKWSFILTNLVPGPNTVRVRAYDTSSNVTTVSRVINYIVPAPFSLNVIGEGSVSGPTNNQILHVGYTYTLTATPAPGFAFEGWTGDFSFTNKMLAFTMPSNLDLTAIFVEVAKPSVTITSPVAHERWSNSLFTITGKARDIVRVAGLGYQLNSEPWSTNVMTTNSWTNWSATVTLTPGANTIKAYASNGVGNISVIDAVSFICVLSANLSAQTNGRGHISPNYNNALLVISNHYTMTATPANGYVFSNWTDGVGEVVTNGPILTFTMQSNLDFTANFIPNPFPPAAVYQGLFYNTNDITPASSGFFTAQVNGYGSFTAKFQQGNKIFPVSGQFSLLGDWSTNAVKAWDNTAISLQLDLSGGTLEGALANLDWTADLESSPAVFSRTNPAPQAGKYTLIIPGTNSPDQPGGNGFGSVTVAANGSVTFVGMLGDGMTVSQSATESAQRQWPFYIAFDSGNGVLLGWLVFTNEPSQDIDGVLTWINPAQPSAKLYPAGFTNQMEVAGSAYAFSPGAIAIDLTNGYMLLENGGLAQTISNQFRQETNNILKGEGLRMTITNSTGLFHGAITNAGKTIIVNGAVLQKQTNGFGLFLNGDQSGGVYIAP